MRADLGFKGLDDGIERSWIEIALFSQHGFQRANAQFSLGQFRMIVVGVMVMVAHATDHKRNIAAVSRRQLASIDARSPEELWQLTAAARSFEDDGETSVVVLAGR